MHSSLTNIFRSAFISAKDFSRFRDVPRYFLLEGGGVFDIELTIVSKRERSWKALWPALFQHGRILIKFLTISNKLGGHGTYFASPLNILLPRSISVYHQISFALVKHTFVYKSCKDTMKII